MLGLGPGEIILVAIVVIVVVGPDKILFGRKLRRSFNIVIGRSSLFSWRELDLRERPFKWKNDWL